MAANLTLDWSYLPASLSQSLSTVMKICFRPLSAKSLLIAQAYRYGVAIFVFVLRMSLAMPWR